MFLFGVLGYAFAWGAGCLGRLAVLYTALPAAVSVVDRKSQLGKIGLTPTISRGLEILFSLLDCHFEISHITMYLEVFCRLAIHLLTQKAYKLFLPQTSLWLCSFPHTFLP